MIPSDHFKEDLDNKTEIPYLSSFFFLKCTLKMAIRDAGLQKACRTPHEAKIVTLT